MIEFITYFVFLTRSVVDGIFSSIEFQAGGMLLTAGAILNLVVLGLAAALFFQRRGSIFPIKVWLPYLAIATLSVTWSSDKGAAVRMLLVLFTYAAMFAIPFFLRVDYRRNAWLIKASIYSSVIPALYSVLEYFYFLEDDGRIKSTFMHPNVLAFYLMVIVGIIYFLLSSSTVHIRPFFRKMLVLYSGLLVGLIILTETRSAWFAVLLILGAFAFFVDRRYLLALVLLPALLLVPAVSNRISDLGQGTEYTGQMRSEDDAVNSFAWRELMWESAMDDVAGSRILGKGLASFGLNSIVFFPLADREPDDYGAHGLGAHSAYVQALYETGILGFVCYIGMYFSLIKRALRQYRRDPRGTVMMVSIILAYMTVNFSDNIFDYGGLNWYFWGFFGTVFAKFDRDTIEIAARSRLARQVDVQPFASAS
ncbi:MAG: O-antigen ligase family protein [Bradyrhizobium sp.]|uniref:O-antigen ligase family protein n=1 Tax=Bradyrhizobium sp. TaxID=376 RepID=UPI001C287EC7|nr:O-antigen ligase family protein [Bradyrhizobium sp.]MBU6461134.1 O-antigen ligase family protein [Pseudomonadota bacterium]MDE2066211.1 O-antigen ligase family protein [Bradyrhizobium sp.]MDE2472651.1 O-antigen ligase family protein [Bradyrhizobium sp.]